MNRLALNSNLPLSLPLDRVKAADWVRQLTPTLRDASAWPVTPASHQPTRARLIELIGREPVDWAVQLADQIAHSTQRRFPHWASTEVEHHANRIGPECMALVSLEFLATGRFRSGKIAAAVAEMMSAHHAFPLPLIELMQSSSDIHARLSQEYLQSCDRLVHPDEQFSASRAVSKALLACTREYNDAIFSLHSTASTHPESTQRAIPAIRRQLVNDLLTGTETDITDVERRIGYGVAERAHRAFVVWTNTDDADDAERRNELLSSLAARAGRAPLLIVDRPASGESWAWWHESRGGGLSDVVVPQGVRVAAASVGHGVSGFRLSHARATDVRRASESLLLPLGHVMDYDGVSALLPFAEDLESAAAFVVEELERLADPGLGGEAQRLTLATLLRTQSLAATARALFVTRSTVTYRLQRADTLLPTGWRDRPMEVALALRLLDVLDPKLILDAMTDVVPPGT